MSAMFVRPLGPQHIQSLYPSSSVPAGLMPYAARCLPFGIDNPPFETPAPHLSHPLPPPHLLHSHAHLRRPVAGHNLPPVSELSSHPYYHITSVAATDFYGFAAATQLHYILPSHIPSAPPSGASGPQLDSFYDQLLASSFAAATSAAGRTAPAPSSSSSSGPRSVPLLLAPSSAPPTEKITSSSGHHQQPREPSPPLSQVAALLPSSFFDDSVFDEVEDLDTDLDMSTSTPPQTNGGLHSTTTTKPTVSTVPAISLKAPTSAPSSPGPRRNVQPIRAPSATSQPAPNNPVGAPPTNAAVTPPRQSGSANGESSSPFSYFQYSPGFYVTGKSSSAKPPGSGNPVLPSADAVNALAMPSAASVGSVDSAVVTINNSASTSAATNNRTSSQLVLPSQLSASSKEFVPQSWKLLRSSAGSSPTPTTTTSATTSPAVEAEASATTTEPFVLPMPLPPTVNAAAEKAFAANGIGADGAPAGLSAALKQRFKSFFKQLKDVERADGFAAAKTFAADHLSLLPEKLHWKIFLEMADLAKRENMVDEARRLYRRAVRLEAHAAQGWLEWAKMEEECGRLRKCRDVLASGLSYCPFNEGLLIKWIKHEERLGLLPSARAVLARLRDVPLDSCWRVIVEGALMESRAGYRELARRIFKYLRRNLPWCGPVFSEAERFEERFGEYNRARRIVDEGLRHNPRYSPLWFALFRLLEKMNDIVGARAAMDRATRVISKELLWKVFFELAQLEERAGELAAARAAYVKSVVHCPDNLLWKVWLAGARTETNERNYETARKLLTRALAKVPLKMRALVLLECARLEEDAGHLEKARTILRKARSETKHEWKVFLESVLLEMRITTADTAAEQSSATVPSNVDTAIQEAEAALDIHPGTGRLWSILIYLKKAQGEREQWRVFRRALKAVPKSGEVWCEGARIALSQRHYADARRYLDFAIQFTPQYGDSFVEALRLELLELHEQAGGDQVALHALVERSEALTKLEQQCLHAEPNYGTLWLDCKQHALDDPLQIFRHARELLTNDVNWSAPQRKCRFAEQLVIH